jgi:ferredoxin
MNVAVVGRSQINAVLKEKLSDEGFSPFVFENMEEITGFSGEKLDFTIRTSTASLNAGYVIVTEGLVDECCFNNIDDLNKSENPIVFILDHMSESPAWFTSQALKSAITLVKSKKQVFYLSRYMRTAGSLIESLYKEARNSGVAFIKYSDLTVDYDAGSGVYRVETFDGYDTMKIETPAVIMPDTKSSDSRMDRIAKIFRLKRNGKGFVNEDISFLFPSLTGRSGIYLMDSASVTDMEDISKRIALTVSEIKNDLNIAAKESASREVHAEIDAGKCAFCYTCFRACPHTAMAPDYEQSVMKNLNKACQACGICISICPAGAIKLTEKEPIEGTFLNAKGIPPARARSVPLPLKILCCENSGYIAAHKIADESSFIFNKIEIEPVLCGGEISVETLISELENYSKVLVVVCIDEACKHFEGNKRAERFVKKAGEMLKASGMDAGRLECLKISHAMPNILNDQIKEMIDTAAFSLL